MNQDKLLREKIFEYIKICKRIYRDQEKYGHSLSPITNEQEECLAILNEHQQNAIIRTVEYYFSLWNQRIMYAPHDQTYDLSPDIKIIIDSILVADRSRTGDDRFDIHIINYNFNEDATIQAYQNHQLKLCVFGTINDPEIQDWMPKYYFANRKIAIHLHIVQPFKPMSLYNIWRLTDEERLEIENLKL